MLYIWPQKTSSFRTKFIEKFVERAKRDFLINDYQDIIIYLQIFGNR